jgi:Icc-related predicted phosphoesterase
MRLLAVSDLHGDLAAVWRALECAKPGVAGLLCCGDWGDPDQVDPRELEALSARLPVLTTFGNHDPLDALAAWRNTDGTAVLLGQGEVRVLGALRIAGIGGIWATTHRKRHYVTDADVAAAATRIATAGPVDILLTHGCPAGLADLTESGRHGGQRCFLEAFRTIAPRLHLCGHLHVSQERSTRDGRRVVNVGATPRGDALVVVIDGARLELERLDVPGPA